MLEMPQQVFLPTAPEALSADGVIYQTCECAIFDVQSWPPSGCNCVRQAKVRTAQMRLPKL